MTISIKIPRFKWTDEMLQIEAAKYSTRSDFQKGNGKAYQASYKRKLLDSICGHMKPQYTYWTDEMLQTEALKYNTRGGFQKGNYAAYQAALSRKLLDSICGHMKAQHIYWTDEMLQTEALKYATRSEFKKNNESAYQTACKRGILDDICEGMCHTLISWTNEMLQTEALKYNTRGGFRKGNESAYQTACRRGIIDDITKHLISGINGFNKENSGTLYYIKFESELDAPIYKIGITNSLISSRINSMRVCDGYTVTILSEFYFEDGKECYDLEQLYHKEFKEHRYLGDNILGNGNTELYVKDVLGLDNDYI